MVIMDNEFIEYIRRYLADPEVIDQLYLNIPIQTEENQNDNIIQRSVAARLDS